jgi:dTDP-4-amino-4,6-dideoxygalactose transaminase
MAPKLESIKAAVTDKTRVILFAFLFGITYDVAPYADFLDSQGIEIIEDCAQSWRGLDVFRGSPRAKMTMFSFGSIKFNAAFYGAISIVRNEAQLVDKMRSIQDTYEALSTDEYSKKIRTFLVL